MVHSTMHAHVFASSSTSCIPWSQVRAKDCPKTSRFQTDVGFGPKRCRSCHRAGGSVSFEWSSDSGVFRQPEWIDFASKHELSCVACVSGNKATTVASNSKRVLEHFSKAQRSMQPASVRTSLQISLSSPCSLNVTLRASQTLEERACSLPGTCHVASGKRNPRHSKPSPRKRKGYAVMGPGTTRQQCLCTHYEVTPELKAANFALRS